MRAVLVVLLGLAPACTSDSTRTPTPKPAKAERDLREPASARYELRFAGAPVGVTDLRLERRAGGYRFRRDDQIAVRRDGQRVESSTTLLIDTDGAFDAQSAVVRSQVGSVTRQTTAVRDDAGWIIKSEGGTLSRRSGLRIAELQVLREDSDNIEPMLLAGASFAVVEASSARSNDDLRIDYRSDIGDSTATYEMHEDGLPLSWTSNSGESARRVESVPPPRGAFELLDLAAMPVRGRRSSRLRVSGANRPPPPDAAGQSATTQAGDWIVEFERQPTSLPNELRSLVVGIDELIEDDLSAPGLTGQEALHMGRGDCSGHASALALVVRDAGYHAKLATGYRRRGRSWIRHRWTVVELDGRWISLDPSFGDASPGLGRLLLLAIHEPTADAMALADLVAFSGMTEAQTQFE